MPNRTMYAPSVYAQHERGAPPALRTICRTLQEAKDLLDGEVARAGKPPLEWADEFGGAVAYQGELAYDVQPVEVRL